MSTGIHGLTMKSVNVPLWIEAAKRIYDRTREDEKRSQHFVEVPAAIVHDVEPLKPWPRL